MYKFLPVMQANVPRYVDMLESLRRGAKVVYDSEGAMMLLEEGDTCMLGAADLAEGRRAIDTLPADVWLITLRDKSLMQYVVDKFGFASSGPCAQVYYEGPWPMPSSNRLDIRHPREEDWNAVSAAYHLIDEADLRQHFLSEDFFCGYYQNNLAAFAGLHSEGSMGMLFVFPAYRRMGFAEEMSAYIINRQHTLGRYAYGQVFSDNVASLALQRKINMTFADCTVWWLWHKEE